MTKEGYLEERARRGTAPPPGVSEKGDGEEGGGEEEDAGVGRLEGGLGAGPGHTGAAG